jgi:hypothetical protein
MTTKSTKTNTAVKPAETAAKVETAKGSPTGETPANGENKAKLSNKNKSRKKVSNRKAPTKSPDLEVIIPPSEIYAKDRNIASDCDLDTNEINQLMAEEEQISSNIGKLLSRHIPKDHADYAAIIDNIYHLGECAREFALFET